MLVTLAGLQVFLILVPIAWLKTAAVFGLAGFLLVAFVGARRGTRILGLLLGAAAIALATAQGRPELLLDGLGASLVFTAFLVALQTIRAVADISPEIATARARFAGLTARTEIAGFTLGAYGVGVVLTASAQSLLAPLVAEDATPERRRAIAEAALRGSALAPLWSPFFVAMAFGSHYLPSVPLWQIIPLGFGLAILGVLLSLAMFGWPRKTAEPGTGIAPALRGLAPLAIPVLSAAAIVVAGSLAFGLTTLQSVVLTMPVACLGLVALRQPKQMISVTRATWGQMARLNDEGLLVVMSMMLGVMLESTPGLGAVLAPWVTGWPPAALVALAIGGMIIGGMLGAHPMITGTLILTMMPAVPGAMIDLALMQAVLIGWGVSATLSPSGITLLMSAAFFRVPFRQLAYGPNLAYAAAFTALASLLLGALDSFLR